MRDRFLLFCGVIATVFCSVRVSAQSKNFFSYFNDKTTYTARSDFGKGSGELLQQFPKSVFRGIGDTGQACEVNGVRWVNQDQNAATQEKFRVLIRKSGPTKGPDATPAGVIWQSNVLTTPLGTGTLAWMNTLNFATPIKIPCDRDIFCGLQFTPAPAWSADGHSLHGSFYAGGTSGDVVRPNSPTLSWTIISNTPPRRVQVTGAPCVNRVWLITSTPQFNVGNLHIQARAPSPSFGAGGIYPDVAVPAREGLAFRLKDTQAANSNAFFLVSAKFSPIGLSLPGMQGHIWIDLSSMAVMGSATANAQGVATFAPGFTARSALPAWWQSVYDIKFQSVLLAGNVVRMSNAQAVNF